MVLRKSVSLLAVGLVFAVPALSSAEVIYGLTNNMELVTFNSNAPGTILSGSFISGLTANEQLLQIDFRPATGQLFALGSFNNVYTLNTGTGAATLVGGFTPALSGSAFGFNFNPVVDRIRVVSDTEQNFRLVPTTGALAATDTNLAYATGDLQFNTNPNVTAVSYTNSFNGATATTLYGLDAGTNTLVTVGNVNGVISPNSGQLFTVGSTGIDFTGVSGFDISGSTGVAYAALQIANDGPGSKLYTINLATGATTIVGDVGTGGSNNLLRSITVNAVPEPATMALFGIGIAGLVARRRRSK